MEQWTTVITFTYPYEAHLAKSMLESDGVKVIIADEMTTQVHNFYSNAIGGVKLQVAESDAEKAHEILTNAGSIKPSESSDNQFLKKFDILTRKWTILNKVAPEIRFALFIAAIVIIVVVLFSVLVLK